VGEEKKWTFFSGRCAWKGGQSEDFYERNNDIWLGARDKNPANPTVSGGKKKKNGKTQDMRV